MVKDITGQAGNNTNRSSQEPRPLKNLLYIGIANQYGINKKFSFFSAFLENRK